MAEVLVHHNAIATTVRASFTIMIIMVWPLGFPG